MTVEEKKCHDLTIVSINGSLEASSVPGFMKSSPALTDSQSIVIDLAGVDFLDSSGLGCLVTIARKKREQGGDVRLACLNEKLRRVFEVTQAFRLFDIYDDAESAATTAANK
ncbi:MAG: STAS domain-containing protein [Chlorobiaceae bacterium]|nr:STAS domain-containing protein [Chlorobiaceae bacterium]NTV24992.1 STAS domain-containing protein [Chlorobiaceae bacterium]